MQIAKKIFPYPIINRESQYSTYNNSSFSLELEEIDSERIFYLKNVRYSTDSELLKKLIDDKKVEVALIIECSETIYRKKIILNEEGIDIPLYKSYFSGRVVYSIYAYTTQDIILETSEEFLEDYQGINYDLEKYSIIAADDGRTIYMNHEETEDNVVKSIFSVIPSLDNNDNVFHVDYETGKKITISLSENDFNNYNEMFNIDTYKELFFSVLLVPSLTEALTRCKMLVVNDEYELDDVEQAYKWFKSIIMAYEKQIGKEFTVEDFKEISPVVLAQQLLGKPLSQSLKTILTSSRTPKNAGDDDE
jgi:hypothetical protein